jgi:hypothetical protein
MNEGHLITRAAAPRGVELIVQVGETIVRTDVARIGHAAQMLPEQSRQALAAKGRTR